MTNTTELTMTQKIVGAGIIGLIGWTAWTTQDTSVKVAVMDAKLTAATDNRYRSQDAARDLALRDQRLNSLADRVAQLERKVE